MEILQKSRRNSMKCYLFTRSSDRTRKNTSSFEHHNTWQEAHDKLVELQSARVARLQAQYNRERRKFTEIMEMKDATETEK